MAGSPLDVAKEVHDTMARASKALTSAVRASMVEAGKVARKEVEGQGRRHTGGDLKFSNMGGARIGVKLRQLDDGILVSAKGPWGMLQPGARPHSIAVKRAKALKIGGDFRRGPVRHPGTPNTRAWDRGREATFDKLGVEVIKRVGDEVEGAFGG